MKSLLILVLNVMILAVFLGGCKDESVRIINNPEISDFSGQLAGHSACKGFQSSPSTVGGSDTLSCIVYSYDARSHKLSLTHINAGFNCCPESLFCRFTLLNDTIVVDEHEKTPACNCLCLFDLFIEVHGIEAKEYYVKIIEPYSGDQENLYFTIDLSASNEGTYCVKRLLYPWGGGIQ